MKLFDAHCHLQMPQYDADRAAVLERMQEKEMGALVIGVDYKTSESGLALATQHDFLWASVGLHPNDNPEEDFDASQYEALAQDKKVVAIGECGLDYFRSGATAEDRQKQKMRFVGHVALAEKVGKPLIIHCRNAHDDLLALLRERAPGVPVVMHFFTGSGELAKNYLDLGCYLSFPGPTTYTDRYDDSIRTCPLERLLVETDAPFAAPVPFRGGRNEPAYVEYVAAKVAAVKQVPPAEVGERAANNASLLFGVH